MSHTGAYMVIGVPLPRYNYTSPCETKTTITRNLKLDYAGNLSHNIMSDYSKTLYTSGYAKTEIELVDCKRDSIDAKEPLSKRVCPRLRSQPMNLLNK